MFKDRYCVHISGAIQQLHSYYPNASIQYQIITENPWKMLFGANTGITQLAMRSSTKDGGHQQVFNHVFQCQLVKEQRNPMGWPIILFTAYTLLYTNQEHLIGYGILRVPLETGDFKLKVYHCRPILKENNYENAYTPEFRNSILLAKSIDRGYINTISEGVWLDVDISVVIM